MLGRVDSLWIIAWIVSAGVITALWLHLRSQVKRAQDNRLTWAFRLTGIANIGCWTTLAVMVLAFGILPGHPTAQLSNGGSGGWGLWFAYWPLGVLIQAAGLLALAASFFVRWAPSIYREFFVFRLFSVGWLWQTVYLSFENFPDA